MFSYLFTKIAQSHLFSIIKTVFAYEVNAEVSVKGRYGGSK